MVDLWLGWKRPGDEVPARKGDLQPTITGDGQSPRSNGLPHISFHFFFCVSLNIVEKTQGPDSILSDLPASMMSTSLSSWCDSSGSTTPCRASSALIILSNESHA